VTNPRPSASRNSPETSLGRARTKVAGVVGLAAMLALIAWLAALGGPHDAPSGLAAVLITLAHAGIGPLLYLLAGAGFGRVFAPWLKDSAAPIALQLASGTALLLLLSHVLGVAGVLTLRFAGVPAALIVDLVGIGLLFAQLQSGFRSHAFTLPAVQLRWLIPLPPAALLLVASCQPPGWLWSSEFGGFDALSYHLQLVNEWFGLGRIAPVTHNVYSALPSLVEGAFLHVRASVPDASEAATRAQGLLSGEGGGALSAQLLHAGLALVCASTIAALVRTLATLAGAARAPLIGIAAATIFLSTPWTIVTASLAYNEMGLTLGMAGAMLACLDPGLKPKPKAILAGLLVGVACGSKATAIFFAGLPVAVLLAHALLQDLRQAQKTQALRTKDIVIALSLGALAGLAALSPWLIRNAIVLGNPVFPFAHELLGNAHWTSEQFARFKSGHTFPGSLGQRLALLFTPDPSDPAGLRHRGLMHPQFAFVFPAAAAFGVAALISRRTHRLAALLLAGLILNLIAWMFLTHLQSRFLIPALVPAVCLIGLGVAAFTREDRLLKSSPVPITLALLGAAFVFIDACFIYSRERLGRPNEALVFGPTEFTGQNLARQLAAFPPAERQRLIDNASPEIFININADGLFPRNASGKRTGLLYLLGDSTPFYLQVPVLYHTTWDSSPLGQAHRAAPSDPAAWISTLRKQGVTHVLINLSEIARLNRSGPNKSSWYDPDVTLDVAAQFARALGKPLAQWPEAQRFLFAIPPEKSP